MSRVYTITLEDGRAYVGICPWYQWRKVEEHFGVPRERIRRGGDLVRGRAWTPDVLAMTCDSCGVGIAAGDETFHWGNGGTMVVVCPTCEANDRIPLIPEEWKENQPCKREKSLVGNE